MLYRLSHKQYQNLKLADVSTSGGGGGGDGCGGTLLLLLHFNHGSDTLAETRRSSVKTTIRFFLHVGCNFTTRTPNNTNFFVFSLMLLLLTLTTITTDLLHQEQQHSHILLQPAGQLQYSCFPSVYFIVVSSYDSMGNCFNQYSKTLKYYQSLLFNAIHISSCPSIFSCFENYFFARHSSL